MKSASSEKFQELAARYNALCKSMQTGVKVQKDQSGQTPIQLRVGLNVEMSSHAALVDLLIEKGIFTREEYMEKCIVWMEREVDSYKKVIAKEQGLDVDGIHFI